MTTRPASVDDAIAALLKRYDRIGFGRHGVLDAEPEIIALAPRLAARDVARLGELVREWLTAERAEAWAAQLHYNLPEHLQALALRLCAGLALRDSVGCLRQLRATAAFERDDTSHRREALAYALRVLEP